MSYLGSRTKKVTTYGKKRTGVVSLYTDSKLLTPTRYDRNQDQDTENPVSISAVSPTRPKRAPLTSKLSSDNVNLPSITAEKSQRGKKGSKTSSIEETEEEGFFADYVVKPKTGTEKKGKPNLKKGKERQRQRQRERFDGVEIPSSRTVRQPSAAVVEVIEEVASLSLDEIILTPTPNHQADLERLVASATIPEIQDFSNFLTSPAVVSLLDPERQAAGPSFRKIGEASYSEVFAMRIKEGRELVVKVIPLHRPTVSGSTTHETGTGEGEGKRASFPDTSYPGDVMRELEITSRMCELPGGGFIDFLGSYVVMGKYPQSLIDEWWSFKHSLGSASVCPDKFGEYQCFALVVLADGGLDLEAFKFDAEQGWKQAAGVFWQTVDALARAESWTSFEHRDMHEGQILISTLTPAPASSTGDKVNYLSPASTGAKATIIDFGLSRLALPSTQKSTWTAFPAEVYEGKGDQWDVYRSIRDMVKGDWEGFHPRTNVLWLQYLLRYLLHRTKSLRRPKGGNTRSRRARAPRKSDIVDEGVMAAYTYLTSMKAQLEEREFGSAEEVLAWGKSSGYLG